jgi:hypothetical protein
VGFRLILGLAFALLMGNAQNQPFGKRDALRGAVRTVSAERARLLHGTEPKELARQKVEVIAFDRKGRPTERSIYSDYGFYLGHETYAYDSEGFLSQQIVYDANGSLIERRVYSHDPNEKTIRIKTLDDKGRIRLNQYYKHNVEANSVEEKIQNSRGIVGKTISKFDGNGNTAEVAYYNARGLLKEKWLFGYDGNKANPSWEARYNADGSLRRKLVHSYELDPEGNWIKRTTAVMTISSMGPVNESTFVTYRTITYY